MTRRRTSPTCMPRTPASHPLMTCPCPRTNLKGATIRGARRVELRTVDQSPDVVDAHVVALLGGRTGAWRQRSDREAICARRLGGRGGRSLRGIRRARRRQVRRRRSRPCLRGGRRRRNLNRGRHSDRARAAHRTCGRKHDRHEKATNYHGARKHTGRSVSWPALRIRVVGDIMFERSRRHSSAVRAALASR